MPPAEPRPPAAARSKLKPALYGGAALGVASVLPGLALLNCICCSLAIGGGMLAVYLYLKDAPPAPAAPYGDGALLGILTGVFGAVAGTLASIPLAPLNQAVGRRLGGDPEQARERLEQLDLPPQVEDLLVSMSTGEITLVGLLIGFAFYLILFSVFAMIGALIGVAVFHKKALPPAPPAAV